MWEATMTDSEDKAVVTVGAKRTSEYVFEALTQLNRDSEQDNMCARLGSQRIYFWGACKGQETLARAARSSTSWIQTVRSSAVRFS